MNYLGAIIDLRRIQKPDTLLRQTQYSALLLIVWPLQALIFNGRYAEPTGEYKHASKVHHFTLLFLDITIYGCFWIEQYMVELHP